MVFGALSKMIGNKIKIYGLVILTVTCTKPNKFILIEVAVR